VVPVYWVSGEPRSWGSGTTCVDEVAQAEDVDGQLAQRGEDRGGPLTTAVRASFGVGTPDEHVGRLVRAIRELAATGQPDRPA
jgi:hypothetical protein